MKVSGRREHNKGIGRYSPTKVLLVDHVEMAASAKYTKAQAALDLYLEGIPAELRLGDSPSEVLGLPKTASR